MPTLPSPTALWDEPRTSTAALTATAMAPFKTSTGYWVLLPASTITPVGYTRGAVTDQGAYNIPNIATTTGLRVVRTPSGMVLTYA